MITVEVPRTTAAKVYTPDQLLSAVRMKPIPRLELILPTLAPSDTAMWEQRLNDQLSDCGCDEGAAGLLAGFAVSLAAVTLGWPRPFTRRGAAVAVLSGIVGGAILGKIAGTAMARRRGIADALELNAMLVRTRDGARHGASAS